jgi:SH3 domain protein
MKRVTWSLFSIILFLFCFQGIGVAETMYVTDQLYLGLRNSPDPEEPSLELLTSTTKVEVLQTEAGWAEVMLEDGKTGWVQKKFLVRTLHSSMINEELKTQVEEKTLMLEGLQQENASLKKEIADLPDQEGLEAERTALKREIETLKGKIIDQNESLEMAEEKFKEKYVPENRKILYGTGILALIAGIIMGFLLRRPNRNRFYLK